MNILSLIDKKKRGIALNRKEIHDFVENYTNGFIPDYQASALLMALWFQGMNEEETIILTDEIKNSGETLDLSEFHHTIDKHSTGGIGDKLSLIVLPIWCSGGLTIAKMSGRGLGYTGGTIDKLESIPGFRTNLSPEQFHAHVAREGIAVIGQSETLVPADKKLYALRDVTETVDSIPLIAASVMAKKLATSAETIILDVKYGSGAFVKTLKQAQILAELMVKIGKANGRKTIAMLDTMDHPLGYAVGNALEVQEAYRFLSGDSCGSLYHKANLLSAIGFLAANTVNSVEEGLNLTRKLIRSGSAKKTFLRWLHSQGGKFEQEHFLESLTYPAKIYTVCAENDGKVQSINAQEIGIAGMELGAGRKELNDIIDPAAGIELKVQIGDSVKKGDPLANLYTNTDPNPALQRVQSAVSVNRRPTETGSETIHYFTGFNWESYTIANE